MKEHKKITLEFDYDPEFDEITDTLSIEDKDYQERIGNYLIDSPEKDQIVDFFAMREKNLISDAEVVAMIAGGLMMCYRFVLKKRMLKEGF